MLRFNHNVESRLVVPKQTTVGSVSCIQMACQIMQNKLGVKKPQLVMIPKGSLIRKPDNEVLRRIYNKMAPLHLFPKYCKVFFKEKPYCLK